MSAKNTSPGDAIRVQVADRSKVDSSWHQGPPGVRQVGVAARFARPIVPEEMTSDNHRSQVQLIASSSTPIGQNESRGSATGFIQDRMTLPHPIKIDEVTPCGFGNSSVEDCNNDLISNSADNALCSVAQTQAQHIRTFIQSQQQRQESPQHVVEDVASTVVNNVTAIQGLGYRTSNTTTTTTTGNVHNSNVVARSTATNAFKALSCACCSTDNFVDRLGWYYGPMSQEEARTTLRHSDVGTFLLRDSSQRPAYPYSLTVMTRRGVTSVRIAYTDGKYVLDTDSLDLFRGRPSEQITSSTTSPLLKVKGKTRTLHADCVIGLIESLMAMNMTSSEENDAIVKQKSSRQKRVLLEHTGQADVELVITKPLIGRVASLRAMCCKTLCRRLRTVNRFDGNELCIFYEALGINYHPHTI